MSHFYLNSYGPLVSSTAGRIAAEKYRLPPFIDGSIRREPDLDHRYPAISCLCRAGKFAPRLRVGDVVAYFTRKARYPGAKQPQRRVTAILQVWKQFGSHEEAAQWYRSRGLPHPSNCMVKGNEHKPLDHSHGLHRDNPCFGGRLWKRWDSRYRDRVHQFPAFVVCKLLFRDLSSNAPRVEDADLISIFGHVPSTQNPGALPLAMLKGLRRRLKLAFALPIAGA